MGMGTENLGRIYKGSFFARRNRMNWRAPVMADALITIFNLTKDKAVVDVGCATGDIVAALREREIDAYGIEGSREAQPYLETPYVAFADVSCSFKDCSIPIISFIKYDLCISLEVAEHVDPEFADVYVNNLCGLADTIMITAAPPGQGGHHHVNCQPFEYWVRKFYERGFAYSFDKGLEFKTEVQEYRKKPGIKAFYDNVLVFQKMSIFKKREEIGPEEFNKQYLGTFPSGGE